MKVTLIGLGKMGSMLAKRLLLAKIDLTVFNRTQTKMQPLIQAGAKGAATLAEAVKEAEIVVTCLLDDEAVLNTVQEFIPYLQPGTIHLGTSTILPMTSKKLFDLHQAQNSIYVVGNVLGVPKVAEKGELTSFIAGETSALEKCKTLLQAYSSRIINIGLKPYQANVVKICMNYLLVSAIETIGELYTFAEKNEVDKSIINTLFHSVYAHPAFQLYVDKIKNRNFDDVNFDIKGGFKDINLFQQAFTDVRVVPSIANVIKDKFIIALARGMEEKDWSAVTEITRVFADLE